MAGPFKLYEKNLLAVLCFLTVAILSTCVNTHRLNVPRVLLPIFNDFPVNFTLEVTEGGCYKWSSSRLDLIRLVPLNENIEGKCSSAVIVQTVTKESTRNTAIVLAEDITTGLFLRCDVIVDAIFSFNLVTTTRELFIEEAPEAFEVRAYDGQGNEFTTLAGIEFTWAIGNTDRYGSQIDVQHPNNVLRFMTFQESPYETPPTVAELDSAGKKGHITLLEGIRTGSAKLSVKSSHAEYRHVPAIELELIVVANLIILPSDVTMMAHDSLEYRIMQVHQGRLEEIKMPSSQYYLESDNADILEIKNDRGRAYANARGKTKVILHDRNVDEEYGVVLPSTTVNINEPAYITLTVLPHRNWGLILGRTHEIIVEIYDSKDRRFHIGEGVEIAVKIDQSYLDVSWRTQNGSYLIATPVTIGTTTVEASLMTIINDKGKKFDFSPRLVTQAELAIHSPVVVSPKTLAIPWDPRSKPRYESALTAHGGDGIYAWSSQNPAVATVSQNGVVSIVKEGYARLIVSMARNQYNRDETIVHVLTPSRLEIIEYNMEAAIGESIHIHVAMYGTTIKEGNDKVHEIPFTKCHDVPLDVYIPEGTFVRNNTESVEPVGIACATVVIVALEVGVSSVTVAYNNNGNYLMDNVTVSAYEPLSAIHPKTRASLLAVGSSRRIVFKGGPAPWFDKNHEGYAKEMKVSNLGVVRWKEHEYSYSGNGDIYVYEIMCESLGEVILTFAISNTPVLINCRKTNASASVTVTCGKPRYIHLLPEFKDHNDCPMNRSTDRVVARSGKDFEFTVIVKDEDGRTFDNVTSLNIEWRSEPDDYASVERVSGVMEETDEDMHVVLPKRYYQRVLSKPRTGKLRIDATITGYQKRPLSKLGIVPERPPFPIQTGRGTIETPLIAKSINMMLVNDTVIIPNKMKVLNDPNATYTMQVSQGSGYYEFILSSKDIAKIGYVVPTKTITVTPLNSGILNLALVDLCLSSNPAEATVEVQQLGGIQVEAIDKVEIKKCISVVVKLYDTNGRIMEMPSIDAMSIRTEIDNGRISVERLPNNEQGNSPYDRILYTVHGVEEGEAQLYFRSGKDEEEIRSEPLTIQVFLPLKITPRNSTILVGSVYQLVTVGGPSNSEIEFITNDASTLDVSANGMLNGISLGTTTVTAVAVGFATQGKRIVYSKDSIQVRIVTLEGIKLASPTTRIKVGATVPIWVFGIPEQLTPLVMGSMTSRMRFHWSTGDHSGVAKLRNMYEGTGINVPYENEASVRATGLRAGSSTIRLNVTMICNLDKACNRDVTFTAFIKIEIFEELHLLGTGDGHGRPVVLMTPNSAFKLQTNRDKYGSTTYKILSHGNIGDTEDMNALTSTNKAVTVDKNGLVKSGDALGKTIISITSAEAYAVKQTLMVIIEVKPIHYMMLELKSHLRVKPGEELYALPKGMELDYIVGYYDNVGSKFNAGGTKLSILTNRADLATFTTAPENVIAVKFLQNGNMVAKIHNEKHPNGMFDYVNMIIGDILYPQKTTLTVGDVVCFSMPLLSNEGDPGSWQSSDAEILTVDSASGLGRALSPGRVRVIHSLAALARGEIQLDVQPISNIMIVLPVGKNITGTQVLSAPLILKGTNDGKKKNNIVARGEAGCQKRRYNFTPNAFPFVCTVEFSASVSSVDVKDLFLTRPRFDMSTGFYYCDIIPIGSSSKTISTLTVSLNIGAQSRDIQATTALVSFLPPVFVPNKEILFTVTPMTSTPTATIQVHGIRTVLEQLNIHLPDGVTLVTEPHGGAYDTVAQFKVRLMHNQVELPGSQIRVVSDITKQDIPILVRVSRYDQAAPITGVSWLDYAYYHRYTFGTFVALVVTFFYVYGNKMMSINVSVKNKSIFAEKCPPTIKKVYTSPSPGGNLDTTRTPSPGNANTSLRPFSAFEPVYGDPRGFYTPNARRNRSLLSP